MKHENFQHHPLSERIVEAVCNKIGTNKKDFVRIHVTYYLAVIASMMRTTVTIPGDVAQPVNVYAINLAPSGFGKGYATHILESSVISNFRDSFMDQVMPMSAEINLPKISYNRYMSKGATTDPDEELEKVKKEYEALGPMVFSFDSATTPAVKQLRTKLQLANLGSLCLQTDEIGSNLLSNKDVMILFLELFSGTVKPKLIKNTKESLRSEDIKGFTPANMMLFGVGHALFDGDKTEQEFLNMLSIGYPRRSFFGFVNNEPEEEDLLTPEEQLIKALDDTSQENLSDINNYLGSLANIENTHLNIEFTKEAALLHFKYKNYCAIEAKKLHHSRELEKTETHHRFFKVMKLAAIYAFIDKQSEITKQHYEAAIKIGEISASAFSSMLKREKNYVKVAKYLSTLEGEVTATELMEQVPAFKGTKHQKDEIISLADAWGYTNNILLKRRFGTNGIAFYSGQQLKSTNLDEIIISISRLATEEYHNKKISWDNFYKVTQTNLHWLNHHLSGGEKGEGYRNEAHCQQGFNTVIIDVDNGISLSMAKELLKGYKALYYTTKSHTKEDNRFRIILPCNFELELNKEDFKEFMKNLFEWLPFDSDTQTGHRSRKWLSHKGSYFYTDGQLLDVLPFIPATQKNKEFIENQKQYQSLEGLERWVVQNTSEGNRNNQLLRYAYILLEAGKDFNQIRDDLFAMNNRLGEALPESEIDSTILTTIARQIQTRNHNI